MVVINGELLQEVEPKFTINCCIYRELRITNWGIRS